MLMVLLATQQWAKAAVLQTHPGKAGGVGVLSALAQDLGYIRGRIFFWQGVGLPREREHGECLTRKHLKLYQFPLTRTVSVPGSQGRRMTE